MSYKVKIVIVGDLLGIELPAQIVKRLMLEAGDELELVEVEDGLKLTDIDGIEIRVARHVMRDNRDVLKRLAES